MDLSQIDMLRKGELAPGRDHIDDRTARGHRAGSGWRKLAALVLCIVAIGLPINAISDYALLLIVAVVIFSGEVSARPRAWVAGSRHRRRLPYWGRRCCRRRASRKGTMCSCRARRWQRGLPPDVYRHLSDEFDAQYPPAVRCDPKEFGCWQDNGRSRSRLRIFCRQHLATHRAVRAR